MMEETLKARLHWVKLYEEPGDAGHVCRGCGISRPTLRKGVKRYQLEGLKGLADQSKRPHFVSSNEDKCLDYSACYRA